MTTKAAFHPNRRGSPGGQRQLGTGHYAVGRKPGHYAVGRKQRRPSAQPEHGRQR